MNCNQQSFVNELIVHWIGRQPNLHREHAIYAELRDNSCWTGSRRACEPVKHNNWELLIRISFILSYLSYDFNWRAEPIVRRGHKGWNRAYVVASSEAERAGQAAQNRAQQLAGRVAQRVRPVEGRRRAFIPAERTQHSARMRSRPTRTLHFQRLRQILHHVLRTRIHTPAICSQFIRNWISIAINGAIRVLIRDLASWHHLSRKFTWDHFIFGRQRIPRVAWIASNLIICLRFLDSARVHV